ncbi:leucine-, isoleucine-, valine-, threonine-, and alanine-binding protein [gut metagenome]|uniref:Leucine-, isoleucine-, valine-, threonine-, and alanine-binding protein n=1 Tax=gut metagenome TaxID=749906 RepID=J9GHS2_9ZZZZ
MCGTVPNQFAADAFDAVFIVKAALEKAGCTPDQTPQEICDALMPVMTQLTYDGVTGKDMTWDADGAVYKEPLVMEIQNGSYVPYNK